MPSYNPPREWKWSVWCRPLAGTVRQWEQVVEFTEQFVFRTRELLARMDPRHEYTVCRPGKLPWRE